VAIKVAATNVINDLVMAVSFGKKWIGVADHRILVAFHQGHMKLHSGMIAITARHFFSCRLRLFLSETTGFEHEPSGGTGA
jgi:hypothetical protein